MVEPLPFAEMLTRNESIEKVHVGGFGEIGLKAFATFLSTMKRPQDSHSSRQWRYE
jgi:hypothetical protein